ncbi:hypothetical protein NE236_02690 [Actinoallomurus purpureus]|uniref:hypothetical protein n=1 Tax=Actinoallomurus purpureus TaxID=478114 RepID=UPI002093E183|nr:hypothetical protein [Actinoallomurus purpureus]MCO6003876.1 hypothetical protein [Actinoallomurus purpureus]
MKRTLILGGLTAITSAALIGGTASAFADTGNAGRAHTTTCDGGSWLIPAGPGKTTTPPGKTTTPPGRPGKTTTGSGLTPFGPGKTVTGPVTVVDGSGLTPCCLVLTPADPVLTPAKGKPSHVRWGHAHPVAKPVPGDNCGNTR